MPQSQMVEQHELRMLAEIQEAKHQFQNATPEQKAEALHHLREAIQRFSHFVLGGVVPDSVWAPAGSGAADGVTIPLGTSLREGMRLLMEATLRHADGNVSAAARILQIDRATLWKRVRQHEAKDSKGGQEDLQRPS
jgi:transcriptional regulator of acetoin/glycerol metabolism